jgi:hypothetical protein
MIECRYRCLSYLGILVGLDPADPNRPNDLPVFDDGDAAFK